MSSVFISYARSDITYARRLFQSLRSNGVNAWFDEESLRPGERWKLAIRHQIEHCAYFLALISSTSVGRRGYAQKDLRIALEMLEEFPDNEIFVIPVRLDDCIPSHAALRDLNWVDMFPSFEAGLNKLVAFVRPNPAREPTPRQQDGTDVAAAIGSGTTLALRDLPLRAGQTAADAQHASLALPVTIAPSEVSWSWGLRRDYSSGGEDDIILVFKLVFVADSATTQISIVRYELKVLTRIVRGVCEQVIPGNSRGMLLRYELSEVDGVESCGGSSIVNMLTSGRSGSLRVWDETGMSYVCEFELPLDHIRAQYGNVNYEFYE